MTDQVGIASQTQNDKKAISRLVIQKILASGLGEYISETEWKGVNEQFLSENPDKDLSFNLKLDRKDSSSSYYSANAVATLGLKWVTDEMEVQDLEGNVWTKQHLKVIPSISSTYSLDYASFMRRTDILLVMRELMTQIREMVPEPIKVMTLDNSARVARDKKIQYDAACKYLIGELSSTQRYLRRNMRVGGTSRVLDKSTCSNVLPGTYEFAINDGTRHRPKMKHYSLTIPENPNYSPFFKRTR